MRMNHSILATPLFLLALSTAAAQTPAHIESEPSLKTVFDEHFVIGAALNTSQYTGRDAAGAALVRHHFNTITAENDMKWERIHPRPDEYAFEPADQFVAFGEANDMFIVGHTLVWHSQTPRWVFQDEDGNLVSREVLIERMRDHIQTVVGRYKGRVHGWDVVNEALNEDGTLRESPWYNIIGEDYLALAFQFAHEADPEAELYYNDYSLENPAKRDGAVRLVKNLLDQGIPVHGIGTQGHFKMDWPSPELTAAAIEAFANLGVQVMVTELDIDVLPPAVRSQGADVSTRAELQAAQNPYTEGLPDDVQQALADRYAALFQVYVDHADDISRVTFWGVTDGHSWLNNWPVRGRTAYPLLFDREHRAKPAFEAVVGSVE